MTGFVQQRYAVEVGGVNLSYLVAGEVGAPPMVLLHALGMDAESWQQLLPEFAATHRVYALDLRGHGGSDHPGRYSYPLMRDDVIGFLDAIELDTCVLVGHSLGGAVAILVAEEVPHRLTRLIVEDTAPPRPGGPGLPRVTRPEGPLPFDFAVVTAVVDALADPDPAWWDRTDAIDVPTLVIGGGPESRIPQDLLAEMVDRMPDARLVTIPAGHHVHSAKPAEFLAAVRDFLA